MPVFLDAGLAGADAEEANEVVGTSHILLELGQLPLAMHNRICADCAEFTLGTPSSREHPQRLLVLIPELIAAPLEAWGGWSGEAAARGVATIAGPKTLCGVAPAPSGWPGPRDGRDRLSGGSQVVAQS